jgi:hypothetical protein
MGYVAIGAVVNEIAKARSSSKRIPSRNWSDPKRLLKEDRLQNALQHALKSNPAISPRIVAISVGYSSPDRVLKSFPELCTSLTSRIKAESTKRRHLIRKTLEDALQQSPPPTLHELAVLLNVSSSSALRVHEASLCDRLLALREDWRKKNQEQAKLTLLRALKREDIPSFRRFCKTNGISVDLADSCFLEIKQEFDARYRSLRAAQKGMRIDRFQREVERTVCSLRERDEYPSAGRVLAQTPSLRSGGWDQLQQAIRGTQKVSPRSQLHPIGAHS